MDSRKFTHIISCLQHRIVKNVYQSNSPAKPENRSTKRTKRCSWIEQNCLHRSDSVDEWNRKDSTFNSYKTDTTKASQLNENESDFIASVQYNNTWNLLYGVILYYMYGEKYWKKYTDAILFRDCLYQVFCITFLLLSTPIFLYLAPKEHVTE